MNFKLILLLFVVGTATLAQADDGVTMRTPIKLGLAPRPSPAAPATTVTLAPRQPVAPAAPPAQTPAEPVTLAPRQPVTPPSAPSAPVSQPPAAPPEIPDLPNCNERDPYNPKYSTDNIRQIDHALLSVTGYAHAFNSNWQLNEDPIKGNNQCHTAIRRTQTASGASVPQIKLDGCTPFELDLPARACQTGSTIKFLVDTSDIGGLVGATLPRNLEVNFSKLDRDHWLVEGLHQRVSVKEAAASGSMR